MGVTGLQDPNNVGVTRADFRSDCKLLARDGVSTWNVDFPRKFGSKCCTFDVKLDLIEFCISTT